VADDADAFVVAIVGAGFAGVATAYHLAKRHLEGGEEEAEEEEEEEEDDARRRRRRRRRRRARALVVHLYDEKGIAGGASGVAAGLLHPYTPRGKLIWRGVEGVTETLRLVDAAEAAEAASDAERRTRIVGGRDGDDDDDDFDDRDDRRGAAIAWRVGTVRPARSLKQARDLAKHAPAAAARGGEGVVLSPENLATLLPGVDVPADVVDAPIGSAKDPAGRGSSRPPLAAALHIPEGVVLDTKRYLEALWDATARMARESQGRRANERRMCVVHLRVGVVVDALSSLRGYDAVVSACGAASGSLRELSGDGTLPTQLQGGHVLELVPAAERGGGGDGGDGKRNHQDAWSPEAPGILGSPYIAPLGRGRLLVGATKEYDASVEDARRAGAVYRRDGATGDAIVAEEDGVDAAAVASAERAEASLLASSAATYPPLARGDSRVDVVRYGVRANPPRTPLGSLPLIGRLEIEGSDAAATRTWFVGGLGARGLVYHAMLAKTLARAVLTGDAGVIPSELRFDPK